MKKNFTEFERNLITAICSLYSIQTRVDKDGVFVGMIPSDARITLNGAYFLKLLNTSNVVYIENKNGLWTLTIIAQ